MLRVFGRLFAGRDSTANVWICEVTNEIIGGRIWDYDHLIPFRDSSAGCVLSKHCGVNGGFMKVVTIELLEDYFKTF